MRTQLAFWITIVAMTAAAVGLAPMLCALESHPRDVIAGKVLPCVSIARAGHASGGPL